VAAVLDGPMAAVEGQDVSSGGFRGMTGHPVDGVDGGRAGLLIDRPTLDQTDLADAGKIEGVIEARGGPGKTLFDASMSQGGWLVEVGLSALLKDEADILAQRRMVVFDGEDVVGLVLEQRVGELALGEQGIGGDGFADDIEGFEERDDPPDLMGLLERIVAAYGRQGADFFWV